MSLKDLSEIRRLRQRREEVAEAAFAQARAARERATQLTQMARASLSAYDLQLKIRILSFNKKIAAGVSPAELISTRAFHSELSDKRVTFLEAIREAEAEEARMLGLEEEARAAWFAAQQAREKIEDAEKDARRALMRESGRREERDADELTIARAGRWSISR